MHVSAAEKFGDFTKDKICVAGIAVNNYRSPEGIKVLSSLPAETTVAYYRDDGKLFSYICKLEGNEIRWRDKTMSRWNKTIKLYYSISNSGRKLNIKQLYFSEETKKSFSVSEL